jgi:hypothetical protein
MRKTLYGLGILIPIAGIIAFIVMSHSGARQAAADSPCTATGYVRDGINMTAKVMNPAGTVTGQINATGCNIGVYFGPGHTGTVQDAEVFGANYFGIVSNGGAVDVQHSSVHDIGEHPFNGSQHGLGIYYTNGASGTIADNSVWHYQKNGITATGSGTSAEITGNVVTGLGHIDFNAQNGIELAFGASGTITQNIVSDNYYTGEVGVTKANGNPSPEGWEYVATGILIYQPTSPVKVYQNFFSDNQHNLYR